MDGMADKDLREVARFLARTSAIKYLEIFYLQVKDDFVEKLVNILTDFNETAECTTNLYIQVASYLLVFFSCS